MAKETFVCLTDKDGIMWEQGYGAQKDIMRGIDNQAANEIKTDRDNCHNKAVQYLEELLTIWETLQTYPEVSNKIQAKGIKIRQRPKTIADVESQNAEIIAMLNELRSEIASIKSNKPEIIK